MNRLAPILAMLWENWRLTRVEAAVRVAQIIVTSLGAVLVFDASDTVVFWCVLGGSGFIWFSIAKLNGGRFMDGYKPGFPLYLLYTRPVSTATIVGVTMAYDALSHVVMYIVTAALVGYVLDVTLPVFSMVVFIVTSHLTYFCVQYATRSRVVQWVGSLVFIPLGLLIYDRASAPAQLEFSLIESIVMLSACVASYLLTVLGVAWQRRGNAVAIVSQPKPAAGGYPEWLVSLFRIPCPTSSAARAQVWYELKSTGLPVIAIGLTMALAVVVLYAVSIAIAPFRSAAIAAPIMFGLPALLLLLGGNAFGIRRRQGRSYLSPFEATQPYGVAPLVGIKLLVRTACLLVALAAIGMSVWASSSFIAAWGAWVPDGQPDGQAVNAAPKILALRQKIGATFAGLAASKLLALAVSTIIAVGLTVAWLAAFKALRSRYPRHVLVTSAVLLFIGTGLVLLTLAGSRGWVPQPLVHVVLAGTFLAAATATVAAAIYLFWSGFARRALTISYVLGTLLVTAAFVAAGLTLSPVYPPLWPALCVLIICLLAPWSLDRLRHA